jgi:hypothetical protein
MVGMLICSAVVEHSTEETEYLRQPEGSNARLLWLQKSHTVSDQAFDSFVLFGPSSSRRNRILTSRRKPTTPPPGPSEQSHTRNSGSDSKAAKTDNPADILIKRRTWVKLSLKKIASDAMEMFTLLGVFFGLSGFILQFQVGLEVLDEGIA